tara:strand:- start:281 stop:811 length:531 start_codon:yes stop_codon:yes gene_type:complete
MLEPEENSWPDLVHDREKVGYFTALTWFRSVRVPQLYRADELKRNGQIAIIDSYYDVLVSQYLRKPSFSWLIPLADPYFPVAEAMAKSDWVNLPKADILVFLRIQEATWGKFIAKRGRQFDQTAGLLQGFQMQAELEAACQMAADSHGTRLVICDQTNSSPEDTANLIAQRIRAYL